MLHIGSFSKTISPALRLGFIVVPPELGRRFGEFAACLAPAPAAAVQRAVAEFLREGHYLRHLHRMKRLYAARRETLLRCLGEMAGRFISQARRSRKPLSMMLVDVDRFKEVNTRFGHLKGDMVLANTAALLKASVRGSDAVFRYGGDEFLLIVADTPTAGAKKLIERIQNSISDWNRARHLEGVELTLSIGVAEWADGQTLEELLASADREMYAAKAQQKANKKTAGA